MTMMMTKVIITFMLVRQTCKHVFPSFHPKHNVMLKAVHLKGEEVVSILIVPFSDSGTLGKLLNLSHPLFLHL